MDIYSKSDNTILQDIGKKIKEVRLEKNITQKQLSELSGVSKRSVENIENGLNHYIIATISIMRALSMLDHLESLFEEKGITPLEYLKVVESRKFRKQARGKN